MKLNSFTVLALILTIVGGINWGLVGLFQFDLVQFIFVSLLGSQLLANIVYVVVGLSAAFSLWKIVDYETHSHQRAHA